MPGRIAEGWDCGEAVREWHGRTPDRARSALGGDAFEEVVEGNVELLDAFTLEGVDDVVVVDADGVQLAE